MTALKKHRWFFDTEFSENGCTIDLISIGLIDQTGDHSYFAVASDGWTPESCNDFVRDNVLPHLPSRDTVFWRPRQAIQQDIRRLVTHVSAMYDGAPEFWAYFADYDWVALCQLFGRMIDLPENFPKYCCDLKQEMDRGGIKKETVPRDATMPVHDALGDARWNLAMWRRLKDPDTCGRCSRRVMRSEKSVANPTQQYRIYCGNCDASGPWRDSPSAAFDDYPNLR